MCWNLGFETFGRDAIDGSRKGIVHVSMATDSGIVPVGNVNGSVGANHYVGRAKQDVFLFGAITETAGEVGFAMEVTPYL